MARVGKSQITLDSIFFSTPEQKLMKLLLSEPSVQFTPRVICSKLKGVRGLGGAEGVLKILQDFQKLGLVDFVSNHRAVRIQEDNATVQTLKVFASICSFESLKEVLQPISSRGVLYGSRGGNGVFEGDSHLFIVSDIPDEVKKTAGRHPMGRSVELVVLSPENYGEIQQHDPGLFQKVSSGIVLWGATW